MSELCIADVSIGFSGRRPMPDDGPQFAPGGMLTGFTNANLALAPNQR
jgi:hypothetical protein